MAATLTTANVLSGGSFSGNRIAVRPPVLTGAQSWAFPRSSPTPSNLIAGGPTLTAYGTGPSLQTAWGNFAYNATVGSNKAYDSLVVDTAVMTLMIVAQSPGGGSGLTLFSNYQPSGMDFWVDQFNNAAGFYVAGSMNQSFLYALPGGSILNWGFYALTVGPAGLFFYAPTVGIAANLTYQIRVTGGNTAGNTVSVTATGAFAGSPVTKTYTVLAGDTTTNVAAGLTALVNADTTLQAAGVSAVSYTNTLLMQQSPSTAYTFSSAVSGVIAAAQATTSSHVVNAAQTLKVGSTVNGVGKGSGSIAWFAAATGTGSQASQAQITQTYQALQSSLALDGIVI